MNKPKDNLAEAPPGVYVVVRWNKPIHPSAGEGRTVIDATEVEDLAKNWQQHEKNYGDGDPSRVEVHEYIRADLVKSELLKIQEALTRSDETSQYILKRLAELHSALGIPGE